MIIANAYPRGEGRTSFMPEKQMVTRTCFCLLLLTLLTDQTNGSDGRNWESVISFTGLLEATDVNFENCHTCLINNVGVDRIVPISNELNTRIYLIKGPIRMLETILIHCNNRDSCVLQTDIRKYTSFYKPISNIPILEYSIAQFSNSMEHLLRKIIKGKEIDTGILSTNFHEQYEILYVDEIQLVYPKPMSKSRSKGKLLAEEKNLLSEFSSDKKLWLGESITETEANKDTPLVQKSSTRCFYSQVASFSCEKCLAIYSSSYGVRAYKLKSAARDIHTLYVFSTVYSALMIQSECSTDFCGILERVSAPACESLDRMFPNDSKTLHNVGTLVKKYVTGTYSTSRRSFHLHSSFHGIVSSQQDIKLRYMMSQREFESSSRSDAKNDKKKSREILNLEGFLMRENWSCAYLIPPQSERAHLLNCLFKKVTGSNGVLLMTSVSVTKLIVIFDSTVVKKTVFEACNAVASLKNYMYPAASQAQCDNYLNLYQTSPSVYPELLKLKDVTPEKKTCLYTRHRLKNHEFCIECVEKHFRPVSAGWESSHQTISYLWWSIRDLTNWNAIDHVRNVCLHKAGKCARMSLLPKLICSEHEQYSNEKREILVIQEQELVVFDRVTAGLWPPTHAALNSRGKFDGRDVLLVIFEAIETLDCLTCMMVRTEVFFLHAPIKNRFGYLWMAQTHAKLIDMCISLKLCINAWYQKERKQADIFKGMRPWSKKEITPLHNYGKQNERS